MAEERFDGVDFAGIRVFVDSDGDIVFSDIATKEYLLWLRPNEMDKLTQWWIERKVNLNK